MLLRSLGFACLICGACVADAEAQDRAEFLRCRAIRNSDQRLACYDAVALSAASPLAKYEAVSIDELENYALSFRGRLVQVSGWIQAGEPFFLLKRNEQDPRSLPIELRSLTRQEREVVQETCAGGCDATVQGRVGPVNFTTGITVDAILVR